MKTPLRTGALALGLCLSTVAAPVFADEPRPAATAGGRRMKLDECVTLAAAQNVDVRASEADLDVARAERSLIKSEIGPRLHVDANAVEWNKPFNLPFALPGAPGPPPVLLVRDQFTWGATISLIQPITQLFAIYDGYKIGELGVDVASLKQKATKRDLAFRAAEAYLRLLAATRLSEISATSVTQLEAQRKQAKSLYDNGVIGKNDFLRAELALATAKQRVIRSAGQVTSARGQLANILGLPVDTVIEPEPITSDPAAADDGTIESAEAQAVSQRIEVREVTQTILQEDARVSFAKKKYIPQVNLIGSYMHVEGSVFSQKDSANAGLYLSWDAWDWGATASDVDKATARRRRAEIARTKLEDEVRLEARRAFVDASSAKEALSVARTTIALAEENYRIVSRRFETSAGTSFDVIDAESLLTQARAQVETALYDYLSAKSALQRAAGAATPRL